MQYSPVLSLWIFTKKLRFEYHQTDTTRSQSAVIDVHGANSKDGNKIMFVLRAYNFTTLGWLSSPSRSTFNLKVQLYAYVKKCTITRGLLTDDSVISRWVSNLATVVAVYIFRHIVHDCKGAFFLILFRIVAGHWNLLLVFVPFDFFIGAAFWAAQYHGSVILRQYLDRYICQN